MISPLVALGDGVAGLLSLAPASVDMILTDPPSGETHAPFDRTIELAGLWSAIWPALAPAGVVVIMASSLRFAASVLASEQKMFKYDLVWSKSVATGFLNSRIRPLRSHEFVLVFSRRTGIYHPQMTEGASPIHAARRLSHGENYGPQTGVTNSRAGATDRFPTSVLEFASVGTSSAGRSHPQQKPEPLLRWLIRTFTDRGNLVVDPFAGSGSAGRAAVAEGRRFVGWDSDSRFGHARSVA